MKNTRKLALVLAFIMFIGYIPNIGLENVFAKATTLQFRSESMLQVDEGNDNPVYQSNGQDKNAIMFEWDTEILDKNEETLLSYQLNNDEKVYVQTTKTSTNPTNMTVDIWVTDDTGAIQPFTVSDYLIYTTQEREYVSVSKFFDTAGDPAYAYNDNDYKSVVNTRGTNEKASFIVTNEFGYSIKYQGLDLRFLLQADGTFNFYQNSGFLEGRVYDIEFASGVNAATITPIKRKFSLGLDFTQVSTQPFVDEGGNGTPDQYAETKYDIETNNNVSLQDGDYVGFDYTIELPYEYDLTNQNFATNGVTEPSEVVMQFAIPSDSNYFALTVQIPANPEGKTPTISSAPMFKEGGNYKVLDVKDNQLTVRFSGLKEGLLLTPTINYTIVDTDPNTPSLVKSSDDTADYAYTFPKYTIVNKDGADYVSIEPFVGYAGHYVLYSATAATTSSAVNITSLKYSSAFFKEDKSSTDNILLPLSPIPETGAKIYDYKIFFNPNERFTNPASLLDNGLSDLVKLIRTRYFCYEAKNRGTIGFPNNFEISNENQSRMFKPNMPAYNTDGSGNYVENFQDLSYTLAWDIGKISSIDSLLDGGIADLTYTVELGNTVETDERLDFLQLTFTLDGSAGEDKAERVGEYGFTFIGEDGSLTNAPKDDLNNIKDVRIVTAYSTQSNGYVYRVEVDVENVILDANKENDYLPLLSDLYFQYPNIYFMVVRPEVVETATNTYYFDASNSSVVRSLTLNKDSSIDLREPVDVSTSNMVTQFIGETDSSGRAVTQDQVSFEVSYKVQQEAIESYMSYYFTNYDLSHFGQNMQFTNDIYISQNYDLMNNTIASLNKADRVNKTIELDLSNYDFSANVNDSNTPVVMMRTFKNNTTNPDVVQTSESTPRDGIEVLRDSEVLRISNVPMYEPTIDEDDNYTLPISDIVNKIVIDGLDTNAKYYVFVDLNVEYLADNGAVRYTDNKSTEPLNESSDISALASSTTGSYLQQPTITDEVPVMPDIELVEVGRNNYAMTWERVDMVIADPTRYEQEFQYEVLRIRDTKLQEEYLDSRLDLEHVFTNEISESITDKSAQRLYEDSTSGEGKVLLYDPETNKFVTPESNLYNQSYDGTSIVYEDNTLSANKVYFVYARTVRIITDIETGDVFTVYSAWDALSATTVLGDPPIDLTVLYNYSETFDSQTEIPLSFRAKVPNLEDLGTELTFEVTYRFDGNDWVTPITINSTKLKNSASEVDSEGYRTFTFLLEDLKPGKAYSIKVRQANTDGSYTPYSNTVQWKTDIDEDEYDKNNELDAFEGLMDDLVDRLIDGSQIELTNDSKEKVVMINGNNLANEISNSKANTIIINSLEKGKDNTLIIPFEAYESANGKGLGWQFSYSDMFFNMSANTIDQTYNENVLAMNKKIDMDYVDDYYLELVFDYKSAPTTLQGDERLTDLIEISANLRATDENVLDFQEAELKATLEEVRNSTLALAKKQDVLDKIAAGVTNEEALQLIYGYADYVEGLFQKAFNSKLKAIRASRDDESVYSLDKNMIMGTNYQNILSKVTAYSVNNYSLALPMSTTRSTNVTTAVVRDFGTYGFGGNVVNIVGTIDNQNGNNNVSTIVATNDLEDTLSNVGSYIDTNSTITVAQALQSMANITGMTETEVKSALSSKGVTINRNNESKDLTEDLAAAIVGVLYEEVNNVNPDRVTIKDYNFYNSVKSSGTSEGYVKHIQIAKEMGLISTVPSTSNKVTVGTFLGMLSKI